MRKLEVKEEQLRARLRVYGQEDVAVAFSGGVDSSLLLHLCCEAAAETGKKVHAVTVSTRLHPVKERKQAKEQAEKEGAFYHEIWVDELTEAGIRYNPKDRCYLCKKCLFLKIRELGKKLHAGVILEGSNAEDLTGYRPGIRALRELGVISPLADCGVTKKEVREMAKKLSLACARKPSSPCLATRIPYGTEITVKLLERIEKGEEYLGSLGLYNVRLRAHGEIARIETDRQEFPIIMEKKEEVCRRLMELGFIYVTLDLEGFRSGSMDIDGKSEGGHNG